MERVARFELVTPTLAGCALPAELHPQEPEMFLPF
jgi:hypothetical protein